MLCDDRLTLCCEKNIPWTNKLFGTMKVMPLIARQYLVQKEDLNDDLWFPKPGIICVD